MSHNVYYELAIHRKALRRKPFLPKPDHAANGVPLRAHNVPSLIRRASSRGFRKLLLETWVTFRQGHGAFHLPLIAGFRTRVPYGG